MREVRCRPHGWGANHEIDFEIKDGEKTENFAYEKCHAQEITLMQVMFTIPGPLREFTASRSTVRVEVAVPEGVVVSGRHLRLGGAR